MAPDLKKPARSKSLFSFRLSLPSTPNRSSVKVPLTNLSNVPFERICGASAAVGSTARRRCIWLRLRTYSPTPNTIAATATKALETNDKNKKSIVRTLNLKIDHAVNKYVRDDERCPTIEQH